MKGRRMKRRGERPKLKTEKKEKQKALEGNSQCREQKKTWKIKPDLHCQIKEDITFRELESSLRN